MSILIESCNNYIIEYTYNSIPEYNLNEGINDTIKALWQKIKDFFKRIWNWIKDKVNKFLNIFRKSSKEKEKKNKRKY